MYPTIRTSCHSDVTMTDDVTAVALVAHTPPGGSSVPVVCAITLYSSANARLESLCILLTCVGNVSKVNGLLQGTNAKLYLVTTRAYTVDLHKSTGFYTDIENRTSGSKSG